MFEIRSVRIHRDKKSLNAGDAAGSGSGAGFKWNINGKGASRAKQ